MPAACIALLNQKGGVGKTSTCHHLAGTLAHMGRRVLLVDNDPQSSLTQGLWGPQATRDLDPNRTVNAVYRRARRAGRSSTHRAWTASIGPRPPARRRVQQRSAAPCIAQTYNMPSATSSARRRAATISS